MRQVPQTALSPSEQLIGIVGQGRVGSHLSHYLNLLHVPHRIYSRHRQTEPAEFILKPCTHIALAIRDAEIEPFIQDHPWLQSKTLIHFSGALSTSLAWGAHPLYTFGSDLYDLDTYRKIPFVLDRDAPNLDDLLPGVSSNPTHRLSAENKALYHAGCVLAGNFTTILWQKFFSLLEGKCGIQHEAALPYLEQISKNLGLNPNSALTGPLARGDKKTIEKNLAALGSDPFADIYRKFVDAYSDQKSKKEGASHEHLSI